MADVKLSQARLLAPTVLPTNLTAAINADTAKGVVGMNMQRGLFWYDKTSSEAATGVDILEPDNGVGRLYRIAGVNNFLSVNDIANTQLITAVNNKQVMRLPSDASAKTPMLGSIDIPVGTIFYILNPSSIIATLSFENGGDSAIGSIYIPPSSVSEIVKLSQSGANSVWLINNNIAPESSIEEYIPALSFDYPVTAPATLNGTETTTNKNTYSYAVFPTTPTSYVQFTVPLNKHCYTGKVRYQFYARTPDTTGSTFFNLQAVAMSNNEAMDAAYGSAVAVELFAGTANSLRISTLSGVVTIGGSPQAGDLINFRFYRASGLNTLASVVNVLGVKLYWDVGG